eukprot:NODE_4111_length_1934_cov_10.599336.p1 GENE.NODE_4111_length_1934_cov_10.599336~~NODE_4111_length_1934_cov_10.599336.p1  ORF type:complete len:554 (-),score=152.54 NODE_4111_length_1934_cov_10.599336:158-1819(-)
MSDAKNSGDEDDSPSGSEDCEQQSPSSEFDYVFPDGFVIGVGSSAYQIEGLDGRGPTVWDTCGTHSREPGSLSAGHACDHVARFRDDVAILATLGVQAYRFSISWSRIMPEGEGDVNEAGMRFYSDLLDELTAKGIEPWVVLHHWDLPAALQSRYNGWLGPKADLMRCFGTYARTCFKHFGDRVKRWITIVDPWTIVVQGYVAGTMPPGGSTNPMVEPYIAAHNILLAHAEAVRIYRTEFGATQGHQIGIALLAELRSAVDQTCDADVDAADTAMDFVLGWFASPIFNGSYPESMQRACGERLPVFTEEERHIIRGSIDFLGVISNTSTRVKPNSAKELPPGYMRDQCVEFRDDPACPRTGNGMPVTPARFREMLLLLQRSYRPPGGLVVIGNSSACDPSTAEMICGQVPQRFNPGARPVEDFENETFGDDQRVLFMQAHLSALHGAIEAGADIRAYFAWSFLDGYQWQYGYDSSHRRGLVRVDFETQQRTVKQSGRFLAGIARKKGFLAPVGEFTYKLRQRRCSEADIFAAGDRLAKTLGEHVDPTRRRSIS